METMTRELANQSLQDRKKKRTMNVVGNPNQKKTKYKTDFEQRNKEALRALAQSVSIKLERSLSPNSMGATSPKLAQKLRERTAELDASGAYCSRYLSRSR